MTDIDIARGRAHGRSRPSLQRIVRKKPRKRFRGTPPPLPFDIRSLPDSTLLTDTETAAAIRRSKACLENWRKYANHPLKWRRVNGRVLYEITSIRALLGSNPVRRRRCNRVTAYRRSWCRCPAKRRR
jgi:hypothetical protein